MAPRSARTYQLGHSTRLPDSATESGCQAQPKEARSKSWLIAVVGTLLALGADARAASAQRFDAYSNPSATREVRRIGSAEGPHVLAFVWRLLVAQDGSLVVGDVGEVGGPVLKVFDQNGTFLRTIGRGGEGPGEFRRLTALGSLADTIWTADLILRRQTLFDASGNVLRTLTVQTQPEPDRPRSTMGLLLADGFALAPASGGSVPAQPYETLPLLVIDRAGEIVDTAGMVRIGSSSLRVIPPTGGLIALSDAQLFDDRPLWTPAPDGSGAVIVERPQPTTDSAAIVVTKVAANGRRLFRRALPYSAVRTEDEHVARAVSTLTADPRLTERMERFGSSAAIETAIRASLFIPDYLPAVTALVVGRDGSIWLRRTGDYLPGDDVWTVLDERGEVVRHVQAPRDYRLLAADRNSAWGATMDASGVPVIVQLVVDGT